MADAQAVLIRVSPDSQGDRSIRRLGDRVPPEYEYRQSGRQAYRGMDRDNHQSSTSYVNYRHPTSNATDLIDSGLI